MHAFSYRELGSFGTGQLGGTIPESFGNLVNLETMYISFHFPFSERMLNCCRLSFYLTLIDRDLSGNSFIDSIPASFKNLKKLTYLSPVITSPCLYNPRCDFNFLSRNLCFNNFRGFLPDEIGEMSGLVELCVI